MALSYDIDNNLTALEPMLDEHGEWFGQVMRRLFYPESQDRDKALPPPAALRQWMDAAVQKGAIEDESLTRLRGVYDDMVRNAAGLLNTAGEKKPDVKDFDAFVNAYDGFVNQLRRLERDSVLADSGIDSLTGLRSRKAMEKDLERELERRARRGNPLCLVLARLDNFDAVRAALDEAQMRLVFEKASVHIKRCIRTFDDAYRYTDSEFVMALKHSDTAGGTAAIERLRGFLDKDPIAVKAKDGTALTVTMSYCAAEPLPGDELPQLLANMRSDLLRYQENGGAMLEYAEKSPLQRFISTMEGEGKA